MHAPYGRETRRNVGHVLLDSLDIHCDQRLLQASGCRSSLPWSGQHKRKSRRNKGLSLLPVGLFLPSLPGKSQHLLLTFFRRRSRIAKSDYEVFHVSLFVWLSSLSLSLSLSVRIEQLYSNWADFH